MSITDDQINDMIRNAQGKTFTLSEATDFMKTIDSYSATRRTINWKNARTGSPVSIGYTN